MRIAAITVICSCFASIAGAQVQVTLPLQGYYRVGEYMPVQFSNAHGHVTISAAGAMAVETDTANGSVPLLVVRKLPALNWSDAVSAGERRDLPLRELGENDRLVACSPNTFGFARRLFPDTNVIEVDWDVQEFRRAPAMAWEILDAIILDAPWPEAVARAMPVESLIGNGTVIAVKNPTRPDMMYPWRQTDGYWVLKHELAGPKNSLAGETAYAPTFGWRTGQPDGFRRQVMIIAIVLSILLAAASLAPSQRVGLLLIFTIAMLALAAIGTWSRTRSPVSQETGGVEAFNGYVTQDDQWSYQAAPLPVDSMVRCQANTRPIFADARQFDQMEIKLQWVDGPASPRFVFKLKQNARMAFLSRTVTFGNPPLLNLAPLTSPMESLAQALYMQPRDRIVGQLNAIDGWPTVFVDRRH